MTDYNTSHKVKTYLKEICTPFEYALSVCYIGSTTHDIIIHHPWNCLESVGKLLKNKPKTNQASIKNLSLDISQLKMSQKLLVFVFMHMKKTHSLLKNSTSLSFTLLFTFEPASSFLPAHRCHSDGQLPVCGLLGNRARAEEQFNEGRQWIRSVCVGQGSVIVVCGSVLFYFLSQTQSHQRYHEFRDTQEQIQETRNTNRSQKSQK